MNNIDALRFPIGKFSSQDIYTDGDVKNNINRIENIPLKIERVAMELTTTQLETPYREGGWTARQVLHHLSDSHMNAYIRFKWTLTEDTPTIKAYNEKAWAETAEIKFDPSLSISLLKALHTKWVVLLKQLTPSDLTRTFIHPDTKKNISLSHMIALYAWHGEHHLGHLQIVAAKA